MNYGPKIVTNGLILMLDAADVLSYSGTGSTWTDLSGYNNHFTLNGSLTHSRTAGFSGFTQTNRWYRNSFPTNLKTSQGGNGYTTVVWARCNGLSGVWQKLIGNGDDQNYIDIYAGISTGYYRSEEGSTLYYNSGINVAQDSFYIADSVWRMYCTTNLNGGNTSNPADAFGIGSEGDAAANFPWNGNIMSVMLYNRVLSTDEMTQNYNAHRSRFGV